LVDQSLDSVCQTTPHSTPSTSDVIVREFQPEDAVRWTEFVTEHPEANFYHTLEWKDFIQEVFGHSPLYLICESGGNLCGVLPLFLIKFPLLRAKLISLPYDIGSGGALASNDEAERILVFRAMRLAQEMGVRFLELRYGSPREALKGLQLTISEPVLISEMILDDEKQVWAGISKDHRKAIRKAENRGIVVREAKTLDDYRQFYRIILHVFRNFGTPPYGANYFPILWKKFYLSGAVRLLLAYGEERCLGGLLFFCWGKNLVSKFAASLPEAVPLRAYAALYWRAIQFGLESGFRKLSWGTSSRDQTGLIEFKERWGASSRPAVLYTLPVHGTAPPIERYYDSKGITRQAWRFQPLWTTQVLGGFLNRWFC
jgi:FemAB-related protein (PEP-CTERM system-associated)